jgi:hypothetical protein
VKTAAGRFVITTMPFNMAEFEGFDKKNVWVCDVKEKEGERDNDFLFCASLDGAGLVGSKGQYCVFQNVIYDIDSFTEDKLADGLVDFGIHFGHNTQERTTVPKGWTVHCKVTKVTKGGVAQYEGKIVTSWWGERDVVLLRYDSLDDGQKKKYPDFISEKYYKSRA